MAYGLTVLLGAPLCLLVGVAVEAARVRRSFGRNPDVFRCKLRAPGNPSAGLRRRWDRAPRRAVWVHDVLLVQHGALRQHIVALPARLPDEVLHPLPIGEVTGLGSDPQVLPLQLDDGRVVEVAVPAEARPLVVGPFLAAAIPGLPKAPAERRPGRPWRPPA
jgi:hypothetical protein